MPKQCLAKDIVITPRAGRVRVHFAGKVIAETSRALDLDEPGAPLRIYLPVADVDPTVLVPSSLRSNCPYKGEASYYSLREGSEAARDAVWYYPDPCPLVAPIKHHVAFWGDRIRYEAVAP